MREAILSSSGAAYSPQQPPRHHLMRMYHVPRWGFCNINLRLAIC